jgi:hypothetical protein
MRSTVCEARRAPVETSTTQALRDELPQFKTKTDTYTSAR